MTIQRDAQGHIFETTVEHGMDIIRIRDPKGRAIAPLPRKAATPTTVVENWDVVWLRTMFEHEETRLFRRLALERVWRSTVSPTDAMPRDE